MPVFSLICLYHVFTGIISQLDRNLRLWEVLPCLILCWLAALIKCIRLVESVPFALNGSKSTYESCLYSENRSYIALSRLPKHTKTILSRLILWSRTVTCFIHNMLTSWSLHHYLLGYLKPRFESFESGHESFIICLLWTALCTGLCHYVDCSSAVVHENYQYFLAYIQENVDCIVHWFVPKRFSFFVCAEVLSAKVHKFA